MASIEYVYNEENVVVDTVISLYRTDGQMKSSICKTGKSERNNVKIFYDTKGNIDKMNWNGNILFYKNDFEKDGILKKSKHFQPDFNAEITQKYKYYKNGILREETSSFDGNEILRKKYNEKGLIEKEIFIGMAVGTPNFQNNSQIFARTRNPFNPNEKIYPNNSFAIIKPTNSPECIIEYKYENDVLVSKTNRFNDLENLKMIFHYDSEGYISTIEYKTSANIVFRTDEYKKCN